MTLSNKIRQQIICYFLHAISTGICFYFSIYLITQLQLSTFISGILISTYGLGTISGGISGGKLCDQFGCRPVLIYSLTVKAIAFLCLLFFKTPITLLPILFVLGYTNYAFITASNTVILGILDSESTRLNIINIFYVASNLGLGIAVILMTFFIHYIHFLFIFSALILMALTLYYRAQPDYKKTAHYETKAMCANNSTKENHLTFDRLIFFVALMSVFFIGLVVSQWRVTYIAYLHTAYTHLNTHAIGLILSINPIIVVLCQTPLVNSLKNQNKIIMMGFGGFVLGFGMFLLTVGTTVWFAITACVIYSIGEMIFFAMAQLLCYQHNPAHKKGRATGWFKSIYALSTVIGPTLGGFIFHHLSPNLVWYSSGIIGIAVIGMCFAAYRVIASHQYPHTRVQRAHPMQT